MTARRAIAALGWTALVACSTRDDARLPITATSSAPDGRRTTIRRFGDFVFEASGVVQLGDGRILIAEDDQRHPLTVVDLFGNGAATELSRRDVARATRRPGLDDLEGVTMDGAGRLYAMTSQALSRSGEERPERELLVRFEMNGDTIVNAVVVSTLKLALARLYPALAAAVEKRPKRQGAGLNVEAIAWDPTSRRLLLGLRSPLVRDSAILVSFDNPDAVFDDGSPPKLRGPILLALDGEGIRDLTYDASLGGFLVVAGAPRKSRHGKAGLWLWRGDSAPAVHLDVPAIATLNPEGVAVVTMHGRKALLLVCDDGRLDDAYYRGRSLQNRGTPSRYVVIPYDTLMTTNAALIAKARTSGRR